MAEVSGRRRGRSLETRELAVRVMLAEYELLKQEQRSRIGLRDNLIYAVLIACAAVASATATRSSGYLLLLPPVCALLGWTYLVNDQKVTAIRRYLRAELTPALAAITGSGVVFGWEQLGTDPRRGPRKVVQLGADLLAFCGLPAAALVLFWTSTPQPAFLLAVSAAETVLLAGLAVQIARCAEIRGGV